MHFAFLIHLLVSDLVVKMKQNIVKSVGARFSSVLMFVKLPPQKALAGFESSTVIHVHLYYYKYD